MLMGLFVLFFGVVYTPIRLRYPWAVCRDWIERKGGI